MSSFVLKLIAIITMLIDHTAASGLVPLDTTLNFIMRCIGRISFPIFIFLMIEGFHHTRDIKKYLIRLGAFALISEIPFDLLFYGKVLEGSHQNIFFTLFLGLSLITLMSIVEKKYEKQPIISNILDGLLTIVFCVIAAYLHTDYGFGGILLIVAFYLFRGSKPLQFLSIFIISSTVFGYINVLEVLAIIPIAFYNGQKGKNIKYLFYIFYPAHLLILYLISMVI